MFPSDPPHDAQSASRGSRRGLLMGGGLLAVLVIGMWALWPATPPPAATAPARAAQGATQGAAAEPEPVAPVKLEALAAERAVPGDTSRNPFRYQQRAVAPPPRSAAPPEPVTSEPPKPVAPSGPPPPPPITLKFIGILERANGVKWAVLSDGKVVMHGRDGDIIDGRYRIVKIGTESIELTHVDGRGRQVIRLTGQ